MKLDYIYLLLLMLFLSCENKTTQDEEVYEPVDTLKVGNEIVKLSEKEKDLEMLSDRTFDVSSFSGKAEIASYTLVKSRYQDKHPGESVLIFVIEPFLIGKQVKADNPTSENSVNVLKMNRLDRFNTGVYDYSQYTSVFTPVEKYNVKYPLKVTMGSQDWCGQSFTQINNHEGFEYQHKSYFESEGDTAFQVDYVLTEDNMMNLARLSKDLLPVDEFTIFPSLSYLRSSHVEIKNYQAIGSLDSTDNELFYVYEIPELNRSVRFFLSFENQNRITRWEETYPTISDDVMRTSVYELKGVEVLSYWELNKKENLKLRKDLKLMY